ncbi:MAG: hypothetical protein KIS67_20315 [Verrucomicrobiae bacterium]|nr:hypothetical protein [Verrucomicrobiae bacterium]
MDPITAAAIAQGISALITIWRERANKPANWSPTEQDWLDMLALNSKTADDYKREAAARLGVQWENAKV